MPDNFICEMCGQEIEDEDEAYQFTGYVPICSDMCYEKWKELEGEDDE